MIRIFLTLFLFGSVISVNQTLEEAFSVLAQIESATDYPNGSLDGDVSLVTDEETQTMNISSILEGRQNEVDEDEEGDPTEVVQGESTTAHWTEQGCTQPNEHWEQCGPRCQQSCAFQPRISGRAICESVFSGNCHAGCFCDTGYVRMQNECVLPIDCPTRVCYGNEEYKRHGTACPITCDSYKFAEEIEAKCPKDISVAGCFCKHGYVRSATGSCILPNRCSPGRN